MAMQGGQPGGATLAVASARKALGLRPLASPSLFGHRVSSSTYMACKDDEENGRQRMVASCRTGQEQRKGALGSNGTSAPPGGLPELDSRFYSLIDVVRNRETGDIAAKHGQAVNRATLGCRLVALAVPPASCARPGAGKG